MAKTQSQVGSLAVTLLVGLYLSRVKIRVSLSEVRTAGVILLITFLIHYIVTSRLSGVYVADSIHIQVTDPFFRAAIFTARLLLILIALKGLESANPIQRYGDAVSKAVGKIRFLNQFSSGISLTASLAIGFIPLIYTQFQRIQFASKARGFSTELFVDRIRMYGRQFYPLIMTSIQRADRVAIALRARGYNSAMTRTYLHTVNGSRYWWIGSGLFTLSCAFSIRNWF